MGLLDDDCAAIAIHAFITNKMDCCNSLLYGMPANQIQHWLPVQYRIIFNILVLTYKAYH